jgi:transcriptional regulator with XRE-family HTH domain
MDQESSPSPDFAEAIGRTIKVIRTDQGIGRKELAEKVGISYSYLTEIENGNKPPSSSVLRQIAHALKMRMSQLTEAAELRLEARQQQIGQEEDNVPYGAFEGSQKELNAAEQIEARMSDGELARLLEAIDRSDTSGPARQGVTPMSALTPPGQAAPPRSPSPRVSLGSREQVRSPRGLSRDWAMQPSLRGANRDLRSVMLELERLLRQMAPDDIERLLDYARRLVR